MNSTTMAITNVRVFDGTRISSLRTVVVDHGLIASGPAAPGVPTVEGAGGVLLPGLIDSHVHIDSPADLQKCARAGVTTVLDLATRDLDSLDVLRELPSSPTVLRAGMPASAPGGAHTKKMGFAASSAVTSEQDAVRFVDDRRRDGVDYIKVIVEDPRMPGTAALPATTIRAIANAAHDAGLLVVAHAVTSTALHIADTAGVDVITHAPVDRNLTNGEAAALATRGAVLIPTLTMMKGTCEVIGQRLAFRVLRRLKVAPPVSFAFARGSVSVAHAAGVKIVAGTDANNERGVPWRPVHGTSMHEELALLVQAGLTPTDAIRAATTSPANVFRLDDRGVIATGKRADLLLLNGNPTVDIAAVSNIRGVWIAGTQVA